MKIAFDGYIRIPTLSCHFHSIGRCAIVRERDEIYIKISKQTSDILNIVLAFRSTTRTR